MPTSCSEDVSKGMALICLSQVKAKYQTAAQQLNPIHIAAQQGMFRVDFRHPMNFYIRYCVSFECIFFPQKRHQWRRRILDHNFHRDEI